MSEPIKIFLSVGRTSTPQQESFVKTFEEHCQANGLLPQTVGRTYFSSKQPLVAVKELMRECFGTAILAYERVRLVKAIDRRGSERQSILKDLNLPTVWNQIEATIAYAMDHPLLVVVENGTKSEGLLETGYDWYVKWVDLEQAAFSEPEFVGVFADWKRRVEASYQAVQGKAVGKLKPQQAAKGLDRAYLIKLRQLIDERMNDEELRLLCWEMEIDYDNLGGGTKTMKTVDLMRKLEQTRRAQDLIEAGRRLRPDIPW